MLCKPGRDFTDVATPAEASPATVVAASVQYGFQPLSKHRELAASASAPLKRCPRHEMTWARE
eukprot:794224-Pyramimonas_sp.AAC.1